jgi:predicted MFS family arabinose efflux permease
MKRDARGEAGHDTFTAAVTMALASLFTLIDLFGPQAIVTVLTDVYGTTPGWMGVAINAATIGMAVTGLMTACIADRVERKPVMVGALFLLAVPTLLLAFAHSLVVFAALRMAQGAFMCAAFMVAVAYIAEEWGPYGTAPVIMSAYVTGNVASNILGRVLTGLAAQYADWSVGFLVLAALNVAGGCLLWALLPRSSHVRSAINQTSIITPIKKHLADSRLRGAFAVGFLILFGFIGVFTYVNFRLADPPFNMSPAVLGLLYTAFVFSLLATPAAGPAVRRFGHRTALLIGATTSLVGVILTLSDALPVAIAGLALVGVGTFFSQAVATGYTGYVATQHKAAASGLYLAAYYSGGIIGAIFLGLIYSLWGWHGCVATIAGSFALMGTVAGLAWTPSAELTQRASIPNASLVRTSPANAGA